MHGPPEHARLRGHFSSSRACSSSSYHFHNKWSRCNALPTAVRPVPLDVRGIRLLDRSDRRGGFCVVFVGLPVAIGIVVLRYRCYEIDIINRTLVYGTLTVRYLRIRSYCVSTGPTSSGRRDWRRCSSPGAAWDVPRGPCSSPSIASTSSCISQLGKPYRRSSASERACNIP